MAKNMPENQNNGAEEVQRISREELKQARREAKVAKKQAAEKANKEVQKTDADKKVRKNKNNSGSEKPKLGKRIAKAFKEMISELKKVTWLKGKAVAQSTLVVVVVVLFFLVILTAMDFGLGKLLELLVEKAGA